jgi:hypothetical protein
MNLYLLILFAHVAAAVALLSGSVIGSPAVRAAVRRARSTDEVRAFLAMGRPLLVLEPVAALLVMASGVYLTSVLRFWTLGWVQVAMAAWLVNAVTAGALVKPAIGRVAAGAAATAGTVGDRLHTLRWSPRWSAGGDVLLANDAAILFLMVVKPGLGVSLLTVAGINALVVATRIAASGYLVPPLADAALQPHAVPALDPAAGAQPSAPWSPADRTRPTD